MRFHSCRNITRRDLLKSTTLAWASSGLAAVAGTAAANADEASAVEIGATPQLLLDDYVVDNTWALQYKSQHIDRVFHTPQKHDANPLLRGNCGYACVAHDPTSGGFRMWYQTHAIGRDKRTPVYAIAYASSTDGLQWQLPRLRLHHWQDAAENNIVLRGRRRASSPWLLDVPEAERRGFRYLLAYRDSDGTHLVGSNDGIHFDPASDRRIQHLHSDTQNAIVFDPHQEQYVMYCRAKSIYRAFGESILDTGESRRIARVTSGSLWTDWSNEAANILLPDELDTQQRYHAFYGMPTTVYAGIFFGFLWPFRWNDRIHTELAWSRDGVHFDRHPLRPRLVDYGPAHSWEDEMIFASSWVEVGEQWWIYYAGWDGPHNTQDRRSGIGLATLRKEGFVSLRGPRGGGVVCTRPIRWPGGRLYVNAESEAGELRVRVCDASRHPLTGMDYDDCVTPSGNGARQEVLWRTRSIDALKGQVVRLEFFLKDADLYAFQAAPGE